MADGAIEISFRTDSSCQTSHKVTKEIGNVTPL